MRTFVQRPLAFAMVGLAAVLSGRALAQAASAPEQSATTPTEEPEELTIRGRRSLTEYRLEIQRARDVVIGLFNELNSGDANDVTCRQERPTGSRMPQRVCRSNAANEADAGAAQEFLTVLLLNAGGFRTNSGSPGAPPPAGGVPFATQGAMAAAQRDGVAGKQANDAVLTEEMLRLLKEHPDLYEAAVRLVQLEDEYNEARGRATTSTVQEINVPIRVPAPALVSAQCGATATTEYRQLNTIARVNAALAISDCAAASGAFTVAVRVRDESGTDKVLEFNETWQRSDDQDVKFAADYPIGDNVSLVSTRVRGLTCTCAAAADEELETREPAVTPE
jgi:hypothetical protein